MLTPRTWRQALPALLFGLGLTVGLAQSTAAEETLVDLELVLAVDVSLSMDTMEQELQRRGYVEAIRHPEVIKAIQSGGFGRIAVTYLEWAGVGAQLTVVDWHLVEDQESADAFAANLDQSELTRRRRTSISAALAAAAARFDDNGYRGLRRVIDISGDGPNNQGEPVSEIRDRLVESGVVINGLPLMLKDASSMNFFDIEDLDRYYEACVVGGFGSFVLPVRDPEHFAEAIRQKLILEIASASPRVIRANAAADRPVSFDCLIGEKMWQEWMTRGYFNP